MKIVLIGGGALIAYLYWSGNQIGAGNPGVQQSISNGWDKLLADIGVKPCCADCAKAAPGTKPCGGVATAPGAVAQSTFTPIQTSAVA